MVGIPVGVSLSISLSLSLCGELVKGNLSILVSIHVADFFFHYAIEGDLANMNKYFFFKEPVKIFISLLLTNSNICLDV